MSHRQWARYTPWFARTNAAQPNSKSAVRWVDDNHAIGVRKIRPWNSPMTTVALGQGIAAVDWSQQLRSPARHYESQKDLALSINPLRFNRVE